MTASFRDRGRALRPLVLAALSGLISCAATAQEVAEFSPRVHALLEQMTLEKKLGMVHARRDA